MKNQDLDRLLRGASVPPGPDDGWKEFSEGVIGRLRTQPPPPVRRPRWRYAVPFALAAAAGLALGFLLWHRTASSGGRAGGLQDGGMLRTLLAQYPGRLQGIVQNDSGLHLLLSDQTGVVATDPVWLEIAEGREHRIVVTFSGQVIPCGGRPVMVLADPGGQIMLVGEGFFWSDHISAGRAEQVHIRAGRVPGPSASAQPSRRL